MEKFRIALSRSFYGPDGAPAYPDFDLAPLRGDPRIDLVRLTNADELRPADVAAVDALILLGEGFARASVDPGGRLALIARFGVGYDRVDVEACSAHAIALAIAPDGVRRPVAVATLALLFALTGKMVEKDRLARRAAAGFAEKSRFMGVGLVGRTLGLVGLGNIGAETARLAAPFGLEMIAHDPYVGAAQARELGVELVGLDALFSRADFVSLHCPLTPETHHLADARRLGLMKRGAYLINTARGPIVDQAALVAALRAGRIAGARLDVFDPEPPAPSDPILALDNVILAPHALAHTDQCFAGIGAADVAASLAVMAGKEPRGIVNRAVLSNPAWRAKLANYAARFQAAPSGR